MGVLIFYKYKEDFEGLSLCIMNFSNNCSSKFEESVSPLLLSPVSKFSLHIGHVLNLYLLKTN